MMSSPPWPASAAWPWRARSWPASVPPEALVALCDVQIRRKKEQAVIEALRGTWADEHIFALAQALQSWDHYQKLIADCDARIATVLPPHDDTQPPLPR